MLGAIAAGLAVCRRICGARNAAQGLRDVSKSSIVAGGPASGCARRVHSFRCLGWRGLGVVEGDHPFLRGATGSLQALRDQQIVTAGGIAVDVRGHPQVPLSAAIPHGGGDEGQQLVLGVGADCAAGP
jgi:hypothetical protein